MCRPRLTIRCGQWFIPIDLSTGYRCTRNGGAKCIRMGGRWKNVMVGVDSDGNERTIDLNLFKLERM